MKYFTIILGLIISVVFSETIAASDIKNNYKNDGYALLVQKGHENSVNNIVFSACGNFFLTKSDDLVLKVWNSDGYCVKNIYFDEKIHKIQVNKKNGLLVVQLHDRLFFYDKKFNLYNVLYYKKKVITDIMFSNDGSFLLTAFNDGDMIIRYSDKKSPQHFKKQESLLAIFQSSNNDVIKKGFGYVKKIAISPDSKIFATAFNDGTTRVWNLRKKQKGVFKGLTGKIKNLYFSSDGKNLIFYGEKNIVIWNYQTGKRKILSKKKYKYTWMFFGQRKNIIGLLKKDNTVGLYSLQGKKIAQLKGLSSSLRSIFFHKKKDLIITGGNDGTVIVWNYNGKKITVIKNKKAMIACFAVNKELIIAADNNVHIYDYKGKNIRGTVNTFTNDKAFFLPEKNGLLTSCNLFQHEKKAAVPFTMKNVKLYSSTWSKNGKYIINSYSQNRVVIRNSKGDVLIRMKTSKNLSYCTISPDNRIFAAVYDSNVLSLWTLNGKLIRTWKCNSAYINGILFSPDGQRIITLASNNEIKLWSVKGDFINNLDNNTKAFSTKWNKGNLVYTLSEIIDNSAAFSPDGTRIATTLKDNNIRLWDRKGKLLKILPCGNEKITSLIFSHKGKVLAAGDSNGTLRVWDSNGNIIFIHSGFTSSVNSIVFSNNDKTLILGTSNSKIHVCNLKNRTIKTINVNRGKIKYLSLHSNGKYCAAANEENTVILDIRNGQVMCEIYFFEKDKFLITAPDGRYDYNSNKLLQTIIYSRHLKSIKNASMIEKKYSPGLLHQVLWK